MSVSTCLIIFLHLMIMQLTLLSGKTRLTGNIYHECNVTPIVTDPLYREIMRVRQAEAAKTRGVQLLEDTRNMNESRILASGSGKGSNAFSNFVVSPFCLSPAPLTNGTLIHYTLIHYRNQKPRPCPCQSAQTVFPKTSSWTFSSAFSQSFLIGH